MKKLFLFSLLSFYASYMLRSQDWSSIPVPADPGVDMIWELQEDYSDDFNYSGKTSEFTSNWNDTYFNGWTGPGLTIWNSNHSDVTGGNLVIKASRAPNDKVYCGVVTSKTKVTYPIYMEARIKASNQVLSSNFWALSDNDEQEIDMLEVYGGDRSNQTWFAHRMSTNFHIFERDASNHIINDFNDQNHVYNASPWRNDYHRFAVHWKSPTEVYFYIDGNLINYNWSNADMRTWDNNVMPDNTYQMDQPVYIILDTEDHDWRSSPTDGSTPTVASDEELADDNKNKMYVDWIRVYKPVAMNADSVAGVQLSPDGSNLIIGQTLQLTESIVPSTALNKSVTWISSSMDVATVNSSGLVTAVSLGEATITVRTNEGGFTATSKINVVNEDQSIIIEAEDLTDNGGSFDDGNGGGVKINEGSGISYVNSNDWAEYNLSVPTDGNYKLTYYISSPNDNAEISTYINEVKISQDAVANNGDWNDFQALVISNLLSLRAGTHTLKIVASGTNDWQWNLDKIEVIKDGDYNVPVTGITVSPKVEIINTGDTVSISALISPANATDQNLIWSSSDTDIASVSQQGLVTGNTPGQVKITATSNDGSYSDYTIVSVEESSSDYPIPGSSELSVFPNLANDYIYLNGTGTNMVTIKIFNYQGVEIRKLVNQDLSAQSIDISSLPEGVYIISVQNQTLNETLRFIKLK